MSGEPKRDGPTVAFAIEDHNNSPIEDQHFLESYLHFGAWLRFVQVHDNFLKLRAAKNDFDRLSAVASYYMGLGALLEDVAATLFALACSSRHPGTRLVDALFLTSFRRDSKSTPGLAYVLERADQISLNRKANVDISTFGYSLKQIGAVKALELFGLRWKNPPSVRIARSDDEKKWWLKLPATVDDVIQILTDPANNAVGLVYNKIKHGPQLVVSDLASYLRQKGATPEEVLREQKEWARRGLSPRTIQILFKGSRTSRQGNEEFPATLFLEDDLAPFESTFVDVAHHAVKSTWLLVRWIVHLRFGVVVGMPKYIEDAERLVAEIRSVRKIRDFESSASTNR